MHNGFVDVDASHGGQAFRYGIAFSALTGKAVRIKNIRKNRPKPGLKKQHLAALKLMKMLTNARVKGAAIGSGFISFEPKGYSGGTYSINIGSAGSITLLLQSLMPASLKKDTTVRVIGGTDVPFSPPYNYMKNVLLRAAAKTGANYSISLASRGYYPLGGGVISFRSSARDRIAPVNITERGKLGKITILSHSSALAKNICLNQLSSAKKTLRSSLGEDVPIEEKREHSDTPETKGGGIDIIAGFSKTTIASNALTIRGKSAVNTGKEAAEKLLDEIEKGAPVDSHLTDQLIPFAATAKGRSEIVCAELTNHTKSAIATAEAFFDVPFTIKEENGLHRISVTGAGVDFSD
jgi:RNA 3'-phosphate cyclase